MICKYVGQCVAGKVYFVSFKMHFKFDAGTSDLDADFSKMTVFTVDKNFNRHSFPYVNDINIASNIKTVNA